MRCRSPSSRASPPAGSRSATSTCEQIGYIYEGLLGYSCAAVDDVVVGAPRCATPAIAADARPPRAGPRMVRTAWSAGAARSACRGGRNDRARSRSRRPQGARPRAAGRDGVGGGRRGGATARRVCPTQGRRELGFRRSQAALMHARTRSLPEPPQGRGRQPSPRHRPSRMSSRSAREERPQDVERRPTLHHLVGQGVVEQPPAARGEPAATARLTDRRSWSREAPTALLVATASHPAFTTAAATASAAPLVIDPCRTTCPARRP